jgi:hypothetical protein
MKVYDEHVDGEEATADIYILSLLLLCKFTHKNISSPLDNLMHVCKAALKGLNFCI